MDKKHEDVGGVAQIDKTSVFQEGTATALQRWTALGGMELTARQRASSIRAPSPHGNAEWYVEYRRTTISLFLPGTDSHQARPTPLHRRELGPPGSHDALLRHLQALPEQGCLAPTDGLPRHQGAGGLRRRCHHGHLFHHEGHVGRQRRRLPPECDPRPLPRH